MNNSIDQLKTSIDIVCYLLKLKKSDKIEDLQEFLKYLEDNYLSVYTNLLELRMLDPYLDLLLMNDYYDYEIGLVLQSIVDINSSTYNNNSLTINKNILTEFKKNVPILGIVAMYRIMFESKLLTIFVEDNAYKKQFIFFLKGLFFTKMVVEIQKSKNLESIVNFIYIQDQSRIGEGIYENKDLIKEFQTSCKILEGIISQEVNPIRR